MKRLLNLLTTCLMLTGIPCQRAYSQSAGSYKLQAGSALVLDGVRAFRLSGSFEIGKGVPIMYGNTQGGIAFPLREIHWDSEAWSFRSTSGSELTIEEQLVNPLSAELATAIYGPLKALSTQGEILYAELSISSPPSESFLSFAVTKGLNESPLRFDLVFGGQDGVPLGGIRIMALQVPEPSSFWLIGAGLLLIRSHAFGSDRLRLRLRRVRDV